MPSAMPAALARQLRQQIASTVSDFKAYDVPGVCRRIGLADGTGEEAFNSKFKYANSRLQEAPAAELVAIGNRLLEEVESRDLAELVAQAEELSGPDVTELTRRRLLAEFDKRPLTTELDHMDLIRKLWPIDEMPSVFDFGNTLADDIFRHTVRNPDDWSNSELLKHLGLLTCSRRQLFAFLKEVSGPIAQTPEAQLALVQDVNAHLQHDGYRLAVVGKVSGTPVYEVQAAAIGSPADAGISAALSAFNPDEIHARWMAAVARRTDDPPGAITLARTLLEDVCKWIIDEAGETYEEKDDLPVLYRKLSKILRLAPDDHTEQTFKQILGSCQQIVELLGSLRNKISDAHSLGPKRVKPAPRHAELAVNLSGTMATFLVDTWRARKDEKGM